MDIAVKDNEQIRFAARQQLSGNWLIPIIVCVLFAIIVGIPSGLRELGALAAFLITGPMVLGQARFFIRFTRGENPTVETLFEGFQAFVPALIVQILITILTILWSLLLVIPGIIAALSYSQAFYILNDNPGMEAIEALKKSKAMMEGYKGKLFMLWLSFIGWGLLSCLTLGIGFIWLNPYIQLSLAHFYEDIKGDQGRKLNPAYSEEQGV